jgi:hypothetical protein
MCGILLPKSVSDLRKECWKVFKSFLAVGDEQREVCGENTGR